MAHCPTETDLRAFIMDYLPEQLPHIPEQGSRQEKISRLIERAGAKAALAALAKARGERPMRAWRGIQPCCLGDPWVSSSGD